MSPATVFRLHLVRGYVPWLLCFGAYVCPRLRSMDPIESAIATLHSFRFFGLVFIIPGVPVLIITHVIALYLLLRPQASPLSPAARPSVSSDEVRTSATGAPRHQRGEAPGADSPETAASGPTQEAATLASERAKLLASG
jgi:hypothetical protein